jgi:hypothetical protein
MPIIALPFLHRFRTTSWKAQEMKPVLLPAELMAVELVEDRCIDRPIYVSQLAKSFPSATSQVNRLS